MSKPEPRNVRSHPLIVDPKMVAIYDMLDKLAPTRIPILLLGETGVGKEVLAEWVHSRSQCAGAAFVRLNCAGLTESVVESELFGHERGAFTGAVATHEGVFERAHGGTLLLDELGELPARTQAKLLRVLESGELLRVGGTRGRIVSVRIIAATHRDLSEMVVRGEFRQDLFFRLNGVTVDVPPLCERNTEIVPLAQSFLHGYALRAERPGLELDPEALSALLAYEWPGNVRELRNVIERAAAMTDSTRISRDSLGLTKPVRRTSLVAAREVTKSKPRDIEPGDIRSELRAFERTRIVAALRSTMGNQTQAAKLLGVSRRTLTNKLTTYGLERPRRGFASSLD